MILITRRNILKGAAAACVNPMFADSESRAFQIGACDWSMGKRGDMEALSLAGQIGLDGVQVSFGPPGEGHDLRDVDVLKKYKHLEQKHGTRIGSLAMGVLNQRPLKSDPEAVQWVSDSVDVAEAVGSRVVLLAFFGKGDLKGDAKGTANVISKLKDVAPKAEKAGVIFGLETWLDMHEHLHIIEAVGSPNVQVYYDTGNSLHRGYDIYREIRQLGSEHICELHAKDYSGKPFGQGHVDFREVRRAVDEIGFNGWIQIEGRTTYREVDKLKNDATYLRGVFSRQ